MTGRPDWPWVRDWAVRVFWAAFPLSTFLFLVSMPILRPGGAAEALPWAIGYGLIAGVAITLLVGGMLAWLSARRQK